MRRLLVLLALSALTGACAARGAVPQPFPTPSPGATSKPGTSDQALGYRIAATALEFRGVPYRTGGTDPRGFDCSGLVAYVLAQHGRPMPRLTRDQFDTGARVGRDALEAGDLVFFSTVAPGASHVGIALDDDEFVHAPSSNGVVRVERLTTDYWRTRFVGARRVR